MSDFNQTISLKSFQYGQGTATATRQALNGATSKKAHKGVRVRHISGGSDTLYVGDSRVTTANGYPLEDGQEVFIEVEDPSQIFVIGSDASVAYGWMAY